jgi:hypothetical protein
LKYLLLSLVSLSALAQDPYRLVMVADPQSRGRAEQFKNYMLTKPPFNQLGNQMEIVITEMSDSDLSCANDMPSSPRIIRCDTSKLNSRKRELGGHHVVAFTNNATGGAGGQHAIASVDYPLNTMMHEMMHMYGLADEYCYTGSEVDVYCNPPRRAPNVAMIAPNPPFANKGEAFAKHGDKIGWSGEIHAPTPITQGTEVLGTPSGNYGESAGLYEGGHCTNKTSLREKIYRPYQNSIMKTLSVDTIQPFYQARILEAMEAARGRRFEARPARTTHVAWPQMLSEPEATTETTEVQTEEIICPPLLDPTTGETSNAESLQVDMDYIFNKFFKPKKKSARPDNGQ